MSTIHLTTVRLSALLIAFSIVHSLQAQNADFGSNLSTGLPMSSWLDSASGTAQSQQWSFGVRGRNTETGYIIDQVERGSAAERARLKPGDTLVSVAGTQVGYVGNQIVDLTNAINRFASTDGKVSVLVHDSRSGRLAALRVGLDSRHQQLTGQITYRSSARLPADAVVTLKLENLTRPHYNVMVPNNTFAASEVVNRTFTLPYDPRYIEGQDIYELRAFVSSGGRTILASDKPQRVITQGNPSNVRIDLVSMERFASTGPVTVSAGYPSYDRYDRQLEQMYRRYLGRSPAAAELIVWHGMPVERINTAHLDIMASQEFFDLSGNNAQDWIERVFSEIVGKRPTAEELSRWLLHYDRLRSSRMELLNHLSTAAAQAR